MQPYQAPPEPSVPFPPAAHPLDRGVGPIHFEPPAPGVAASVVPVRPARPAGRVRRAAIVLALAAVSATAGGAGFLAASGFDISAIGADGASEASVPITSTAAATTTPAPRASTAPAAVADEESAIIAAVERVHPATVTIVVGGARGATGSGSGVIVDADGWILTNRHVVDGADEVTVQLIDGRELSGTVEAIDTLTDLAIVRVRAEALPVAPLGESSALRIGQTAIALGTPLGEFAGSASVGIVSGLDRTVNVSDGAGGGARLSHLIQTDAAINPGNSGGPLADSAGRVIGINTAEAGQAEGIGFAIPIDVAKPIVQQAVAGETVARPWIGISSVEITPALAAEEDLPVENGAWLRAATGTGAVVAGSPAERAGLRDGDIVTAVDGEAIDRQHPLDLYLLDHRPGDVITLTVRRGVSTLQVEVTLGTRPAGLG